MSRGPGAVVISQSNTELLMNDIRIEIHPSSGIEEVYEISQVLDKGSNSLKYYFRYERPGGKGRFTSTTGHLIISESKAHKIIKLCQEISIGLLPDFATGLDGNTTLVTISHGMNWIQLKWWDKMPGPWLPVRKLLRMVRAIEKSPKKRTAALTGGLEKIKQCRGI